MPVKSIENLIETGAFERAYEELLTDLSTAADSTDLIRLSRVLSNRVRSKCFDLASNKATDESPLAMELEALLAKIIVINGEDFYGQVPDHALREEYLPQRGAAWSEITLFAATFNAYNELGGFKTVADTVDGKAQHVSDCSLGELRAALFFEFRRYNHFGYDPDSQAMSHIHALVEEIRTRIQNGEHRLAT